MSNYNSLDRIKKQEIDKILQELASSEIKPKSQNIVEHARGFQLPDKYFRYYDRLSTWLKEPEQLNLWRKSVRCAVMYLLYKHWNNEPNKSFVLIRGGRSVICKCDLNEDRLIDELINKWQLNSIRELAMVLAECEGLRINQLDLNAAKQIRRPNASMEKTI
jgi:hypothetical protein